VRLRFVLALVLAAACRTQPLSGGDGGASCPGRYHLEPVAVDSFTQTDLNICPGTRAPVQVRYHHGSCEPPAPLEVAFDPARGAIVITARVWRGGACSDSVVETPTAIISDVHPLAGDVPVFDGAPGSTTATKVAVQQSPPSGLCTGPNGFSCDDAQCESTSGAGTRCDLDQGACVQICGSDGDCPDGAPACSNGFCTHGATRCATVTCAPTQSCRQFAAGAACRPANTTAPGAACAADGDCGPGGLCQGCACLIPCTSDGDCAAGRCDPNAGCVAR
jgi:hypothetical protein